MDRKNSWRTALCIGAGLLLLLSASSRMALAQSELEAERKQIQAKVAGVISSLRSLEERRGEKMLQIGDINSKLRDSGSPFIPPIILKKKLELENDLKDIQDSIAKQAAPLRELAESLDKTLVKPAAPVEPEAGKPQ
jgi:hypothetical protein